MSLIKIEFDLFICSKTARNTQNNLQSIQYFNSTLAAYMYVKLSNLNMTNFAVPDFGKIWIATSVLRTMKLNILIIVFNLKWPPQQNGGLQFISQPTHGYQIEGLHL